MKRSAFFALTSLAVAAVLYVRCTDKGALQVHYTGPKVTLADIPPGICEVVLNINNNGAFHKMELKAGLLGMRQDADTRALRPTIGWAIIDTGEQPDEAVTKRYNRRKVQYGWANLPRENSTLGQRQSRPRRFPLPIPDRYFRYGT